MKKHEKQIGFPTEKAFLKLNINIKNIRMDTIKKVISKGVVCFFLLTLFSTATFSQINLSFKNKPLKEVIKEIEKVSEYRFFYNDNLPELKKSVSINIKDGDIKAVMEQIVSQTGLSYSLNDKTHVVLSAGAAPKAPQQSGQKTNGKVVDKNGEVLPGVTIQIAGSTRGVITGENGNFEMDNVAVGAKLSASLVGMQTKEFEFQGKGDLIIVLEENTNELDEVTIVAFGKQKKESVISSIATVNVNDLKIPSSNLTTAFAGRIAGMISYQTSGEPGYDDASFFIRGVTTFGTGKVDPLILIDNVEVTTSDLAKFHPDDIASFSILKDATATALYGARGANGVILVTTKEGKEGKVSVSFRFENSLSSPTSTIKMADPITYMRMANEAVSTRNPLEQTPYLLDKIDNTIRGGNPYVYPSVDWMKMLTKNVTNNQRANLNISGGGKVARYYIAGSFSQDNG
ncbi:MAG: carboxypeptidase-like regulatory domain-containing protein, partial [Tannerella sp.]|nr:carboxypeptidase-like regulatory domain-containing protein [Tannerella sp.]